MTLSSKSGRCSAQSRVGPLSLRQAHTFVNVWTIVGKRFMLKLAPRKELWSVLVSASLPSYMRSTLLLQWLDIEIIENELRGCPMMSKGSVPSTWSTKVRRACEVQTLAIISEHFEMIKVKLLAESRTLNLFGSMSMTNLHIDAFLISATLICIGQIIMFNRCQVM